jgi:hypothetical protein
MIDVAVSWAAWPGDRDPGIPLVPLTNERRRSPRRLEGEHPVNVCATRISVVPVQFGLV